MCDLEKEIKLLKEKVELLEKIRELQGSPIPFTYPPIYPIYPIYPYPSPYPYAPIITYGDKTGDSLPHNPVFTTCTTQIKLTDQITLTC